MSPTLRRLAGKARTLTRTNMENVLVPGLGTFAFQGVGNTSYSTGLEVYFHAEGDDEPAWGRLRYHVVIDRDMTLKWVLDSASLDYGDYAGERFGASVWENAQRLVEEIHLRDEVCWFFQVKSAVDMELRDYDKRHRDLTNSVAHLHAMLLGKARHNRTIESVQKQFVRDGRRLSDLQEAHGARMDVLRTVSRECLEWSGARKCREPIRDIVVGLLEQAREPMGAPAFAA